MTIIHVNDAIVKNAPPAKIAKNTSSPPNNKEFNNILKTSTENRSKSKQPVQKPPINIIPQKLLNTFVPETTKPAGKILLVQGNVLILKKDLKHTYQAEKGFPIFDGDTIVTRENGQIRLKFNDESITTLAPGSELALNSSVYDFNKKIRSSSLTLMLGKARFLVKKLLHFKSSTFKVKTAQAVCGVRGSDFLVKAKHKVTEVTTFADTQIEVMGLSAPGIRPVILESLQRIVLEESSLLSKVENITTSEATKLIKELSNIPKAVANS